MPKDRQTATETMETLQQAVADESRLNARMRAFQKRWAPHAPADASEFHSELFMLVREIYRDASTPVTQALARAYALGSVEIVHKLNDPQG